VTARTFLIPALAISTALLLSGASLHAADTVRRVGVHGEGGELRVTFGFGDVCSKKVKEKLKSGLPTRLVVQVAVENEKKKPVAFWARTARVVYDLWEENFSVTMEDPGGRQTTRVATVDELIRVLCALRNTKVADGLPPGSYRIAARIEANPVSDEMVRNIQRWIARPSGGLRSQGQSASYFGSFVGYFVDRDIGRADRTIRFVSQWFDR